MAINESAILKSELRWAMVVGGIVAVILAAILFAALSMHINPPSNREYVDPKTLQIQFLTAVDMQGGRSSFTFTNLKENRGLTDKQFEFRIPRGVEVVSNGGRAQ